MKIESKHDFKAKLKQVSVLPAVIEYVSWQRAVRRTRAMGVDAPEVPTTFGPISINLDFTTACNYRCTHCIDWDILNTADRYEEDRLKQSLAQMRERGLRSVILIGGGEPTVYPGFVRMVRYIKQLGLQVAVVSNGSGNKKILEVADCLDKHDWVRLSLDSGTNETFVEMHRPINKAVTLQSICEWVPRIKRINPGFKIGFSFIITWKGAAREDGAVVIENIHEIVTAAKLARDSQFDFVSLKPFLVRSISGSEIMNPAQAEAELQDVIARIQAGVQEAKALETETFRILESTNLHMLEQGVWREFTNQPATCHMQAFRQVLTPTGLYNCPAYRGVDRARIAGKDAYDDAEAFDVTKGKLAGILERFDAHRECAQVTCLYNAANWWLEQAINDDTVSLESVMDRYDYYL